MSGENVARCYYNYKTSDKPLNKIRFRRPPAMPTDHSIVNTSPLFTTEQRFTVRSADSSGQLTSIRRVFVGGHLGHGKYSRAEGRGISGRVWSLRSRYDRLLAAMFSFGALSDDRCPFAGRKLACRTFPLLTQAPGYPTCTG